MFAKNFVRRVVAVSQISILLLTFLPGSSAKNKNRLTVYSNPAPITINTATGVTAPTLASTYPSDIVVSGMTGTITKVEVTLNGVSHTSLNNLDFLLVSPTGLKYIFLSDGGAGSVVDDYVYTFSDTASTVLPNFAPIPGTYRPTSGDGLADTFPVPAPAGPYGQPPGATFASVFNGAAPNGTWQLFAVDDALNAPGSLNSGWALTITTDAAPATFANPSYIQFSDIFRTATPYGSTINVSGETGVISDLNVTLTGFSHASPDNADILLVSPNGKASILMSDTGGINTATNVNLTFDDAAATNVPFNLVSGTYKPTDNFTEIDTFLTPAPLRPYHREGSNQLSNFNGYNPNGEWRLFVVDDTQNNAGSISGGWSLDVTTVPTPPPVQPTCMAPRFSLANYLAGANPTNLAIADFNNDTEPDVAVTNQVSNNISILLGNGDGTLAAQSLVNAGSSPYAIAAGKFDAGNNFDLAVVNSGSNNVSILLGNGDGTFGAPTNFTVGSDPISIAIGDLNNDTNQDLAVANFGGFFSGTISILLGNGSGGFTPAANVITSTQPAFVTITNFNGDANRDLIVANFGADLVSTYLGSGTGTFQSAQTLGTFGGPVAIEVANFLGADSFADLAITNYSGENLTLCSGTSSGTFNCSTGPPSYSPNPVSITSGDYLGNGTTGLAVALSGSNRVRVSQVDFTVGLNPNAVETVDLNGDTKPDLITANAGSNDVSVLINSCQVAVGNLFDYNGDRRTDFSVFRPSNTNWFIQSLNGNGAAKIFARPTDLVVPADYNGDNIADYAFYRPESGLWHILDTASRPIHFVQFGLPTDIPVPADYDGDGKADIAIWRPSDGNWWIRRSSDHAIQIFAFGLNGDKPVPADYDGDGTDDIAVYRPSDGTWYIFRSSDSQVYIRQFGISEDKTVAGDYDGDGSADLAVWRPSTAIWYVLESSDDDVRSVPWGLPTDVPLVGDYEGDGKFDYAVWRASDKNWYIMKSSDNGSIIFPWGLAGDVPLPSVFVR
jgi:subtilisin-like proprotein convertase family protein